MSKLEGMLGIGNFGLAAFAGIASGIAAAKGLNILPESLFLLPSLAANGFVYGFRTTHPEIKTDVSVGLVYSGATVAVAGTSFWLAYLAGRLIK